MTTRRQALAGLAASGALAGLAGRARADGFRLTFDPASVFAQGGWARGDAGADTAVLLDGAAVPVDRAGNFFIAFDRDAPPSVQIVAHYAGGLGLGSSYGIAPRRWAIEHVDAPFHPPGLPDADFARIRPGELAQIVAARARDTGAAGWRQRFAWPGHGRISGLFGAQRIYRGADGQPQPGAYHPGLDIALGQGTVYVAPADGVVVLAVAAPFTLEGRLLMVDHGMGLNSAFLHSSALLVKEGDHVVQGQPIGAVGMTGRATGPHLHWALRWRAARLDPLLFVPPPG